LLLGAVLSDAALQRRTNVEEWQTALAIYADAVSSATRDALRKLSDRLGP
jgi:hypothetical protein